MPDNNRILNQNTDNTNNNTEIEEQNNQVNQLANNPVNNPVNKPVNNPVNNTEFERQNNQPNQPTSNPVISTEIDQSHPTTLDQSVSIEPVQNLDFRTVISDVSSPSDTINSLFQQTLSDKNLEDVSRTEKFKDIISHPNTPEQVFQQLSDFYTSQPSNDLSYSDIENLKSLSQNPKLSEDSLDKLANYSYNIADDYNAKNILRRISNNPKTSQSTIQNIVEKAIVSDDDFNKVEGISVNSNFIFDNLNNLENPENTDDQTLKDSLKGRLFKLLPTAKYETNESLNQAVKIISSLKVSQEALNYYLRDPNQDLITNFLNNQKNLKPEMISTIYTAYSNDPFIVDSIAENQLTPPEILSEISLTSNKRKSAQAYAIQNPNLPEETRKQILNSIISDTNVNSLDYHVREKVTSLISNPKTNTNDLERLFVKFPEQVLSSEKSPEKLFDTYYEESDKKSESINFLIRNKRTPSHILKDIVSHNKNIGLSIKALKSKNVDISVVEAGLARRSAKVQEAAMNHPLVFKEQTKKRLLAGQIDPPTFIDKFSSKYGEIDSEIINYLEENNPLNEKDLSKSMYDYSLFSTSIFLATNENVPVKQQEQAAKKIADTITADYIHNYQYVENVLIENPLPELQNTLIEINNKTNGAISRYIQSSYADRYFMMNLNSDFLSNLLDNIEIEPNRNEDQTLDKAAVHLLANPNLKKDDFMNYLSKNKTNDLVLNLHSMYSYNNLTVLDSRFKDITEANRHYEYTDLLKKGLDNLKPTILNSKTAPNDIWNNLLEESLNNTSFTFSDRTFVDIVKNKINIDNLKKLTSQAVEDAEKGYFSKVGLVLNLHRILDPDKNPLHQDILVDFLTKIDLHLDSRNNPIDDLKLYFDNISKETRNEVLNKLARNNFTKLVPLTKELIDYGQLGDGHTPQLSILLNHLETYKAKNPDYFKYSQTPAVINLFKALKSEKSNLSDDLSQKFLDLVSDPASKADLFNKMLKQNMFSKSIVEKNLSTLSIESLKELLYTAKTDEKTDLMTSILNSIDSSNEEDRENLFKTVINEIDLFQFIPNNVQKIISTKEITTTINNLDNFISNSILPKTNDKIETLTKIFNNLIKSDTLGALSVNNKKGLINYFIKKSESINPNNISFLTDLLVNTSAALIPTTLQRTILNHSLNKALETNNTTLFAGIIKDPSTITHTKKIESFILKGLDNPDEKKVSDEMLTYASNKIKKYNNIKFFNQIIKKLDNNINNLELSSNLEEINLLRKDYLLGIILNNNIGNPLDSQLLTNATNSLFSFIDNKNNYRDNYQIVHRLQEVVKSNPNLSQKTVDQIITRLNNFDERDFSAFSIIPSELQLKIKQSIINHTNIDKEWHIKSIIDSDSIEPLNEDTIKMLTSKLLEHPDFLQQNAHTYTDFLNLKNISEDDYIKIARMGNMDFLVSSAVRGSKTITNSDHFLKILPFYLANLENNLNNPDTEVLQQDIAKITQFLIKLDNPNKNEILKKSWELNNKIIANLVSSIKNLRTFQNLSKTLRRQIPSLRYESKYDISLLRDLNIGQTLDSLTDFLNKDFLQNSEMIPKTILITEKMQILQRHHISSRINEEELEQELQKRPSSFYAINHFNHELSFNFIKNKIAPIAFNELLTHKDNTTVMIDAVEILAMTFRKIKITDTNKPEIVNFIKNNVLEKKEYRTSIKKVFLTDLIHNIPDLFTANDIIKFDIDGIDCISQALHTSIGNSNLVKYISKKPELLKEHILDISDSQFLEKDVVKTILKYIDQNIVTNNVTSRDIIRTLCKNKSINSENGLDLLVKEVSNHRSLHYTQYDRYLLSENPNLNFEQFKSLIDMDKVDNNKLFTSDITIPEFYYNIPWGSKLFRERPVRFPKGYYEGSLEGIDRNPNKMITSIPRSDLQQKLNEVLPAIPAEGITWGKLIKHNPNIGSSHPIMQIFNDKGLSKSTKIFPEDVAKAIKNYNDFYHITYSFWAGQQTHNNNPDLVIQLNIGENLEKTLLKDPILMEIFRKIQKAGQSSFHPGTPTSIGWVRVDTSQGKDGWIIEEIQSDFDDKITSSLEEMVETTDKGITLNGKTVTKKELKQIKVKLGGIMKDWYKTAFQAAIELAKVQGIDSLYLHGAELRSTLSGLRKADDSHRYPSWLTRSYQDYPAANNWESIDYTDYPNRNWSNKLKNEVTKSKRSTRCWKLNLKKKEK